MFERFTSTARDAVVAAQDEARRRKHLYIGPEHLLLGLLRTENGLAWTVLKSLDPGLTVPAATVILQHHVPDGTVEVTVDPIPFRPQAKKVLELALREALSLGHNYIGTEHILLGIGRADLSVASLILASFKVDADSIRSEIVRVLSGPRRIEPVAGMPGRKVEVTDLLNELEQIAALLREQLVPEEEPKEQHG